MSAIDCTSPKYPVGSVVMHRGTGGLYRILVTPNHGRLESTGQPAYSYQSLNPNEHIIWHRAQEVMEDGRFILQTTARTPNVEHHSV